MTQRSTLTLTAFALVAASAFAPVAQASGFQLREQSPLYQGNAFAGVSAGTADISASFFNPAILAGFSGNQFDLGATLISPSAVMSDITATRTSLLAPIPAYEPISGPTSHKNSASSKAVPTLYGLYSVNDDLKLGLSVNGTYGFVTEYDSNFAGRYHALKTDLAVIDIAPSLAYRINKQWAVGVAFVARKADATLTNAMDFGLLGFAGAGTVPGSLDGKATLKGDAWGYGYKAGLTFQPTDRVKIGLGYQGAMNMNLKGTIAFDYPAGMPTGASTYLHAIGLKDGGGAAELNLPANASLGIDYKVNDTFSIQAETCLTTWSRFSELRAKFTDNAAPQITETVTEEKWRDTWFYSLGANWQVSPEWTLRCGVATDMGAVKDEYRTPRIPDADRTWGSVGASYVFSKSLSLDAGYTHIFVKDNPVNLKTTASQTDPNFSRGNLYGMFKMKIDIMSIQVRYKF